MSLLLVGAALVVEGTEVDLLLEYLVVQVVDERLEVGGRVEDEAGRLASARRLVVLVELTRERLLLVDELLERGRVEVERRLERRRLAPVGNGRCGCGGRSRSRSGSIGGGLVRNRVGLGHAQRLARHPRVGGVRRNAERATRDARALEQLAFELLELDVELVDLLLLPGEEFVLELGELALHVERRRVELEELVYLELGELVLELYALAARYGVELGADVAASAPLGLLELHVELGALVEQAHLFVVYLLHLYRELGLELLALVQEGRLLEQVALGLAALALAHDQLLLERLVVVECDVALACQKVLRADALVVRVVLDIVAVLVRQLVVYVRALDAHLAARARVPPRAYRAVLLSALWLVLLDAEAEVAVDDGRVRIGERHIVAVRVVARVDAHIRKRHYFVVTNNRLSLLFF